jgi:excisionase family DNA binding protein
MSTAETPDSDVWLTDAEVAERLRIGRPAVVDLIESGQLPALRVSDRRRWRIRQSEVDRLARSAVA